jgi:hypothetical protein
MAALTASAVIPGRSATPSRAAAWATARLDSIAAQIGRRVVFAGIPPHRY